MTDQTWPLSRAACEAAEAVLTNRVRDAMPIHGFDARAVTLEVLRAAQAAWEPSEEQVDASADAYILAQGKAATPVMYDHMIKALLAAIRTEAR